MVEGGGNGGAEFLGTGLGSSAVRGFWIGVSAEEEPRSRGAGAVQAHDGAHLKKADPGAFSGTNRGYFPEPDFLIVGLFQASQTAARPDWVQS